MALSRVFRRRNLALLPLFVLLAGAIYGFAAANTVPESGAGDGEGDISGYTASDITYTLNATDPTMIDAVSFSLAPSAGADDPVTVKAKLVSSSTTWFDCSLSGATWTCDTSAGSVTVLSADELRVVAAQ